MLAQVSGDGPYLFPVVAGVEFDVIISYAVRREEAVDAAWLYPAFGDHLFEDFLGVLKEFTGGFADDFIVQDFRVFAVQFPGDEERGPVDERYEFL